MVMPSNAVSNAENIKYNFAPSPGQVSLSTSAGTRVRIESAVYNDYNIPPYYDSMIAKIITYADTRLECIKRMRSALEELFDRGCGNQYRISVSVTASSDICRRPL